MMSRKEQFTPKGSDRDSTAALVVGVDILISGRIVQLARLGFGEDIIVGEFSVVNLGTGDLDRSRGLRRDVLDEEFRQSLSSHLIDGSKNDAVAMRIGQVFVDPYPAGKVLVRQFASRKHPLAVGSIDLIAVVINVDKFVIG